MSKEYYEAHVTFSSTKEIGLFGWKFSKIDGDPVLGDGVKSYLTRQFKATRPLSAVVEELEQVATNLREDYGEDVLRTKVELVVYDSKNVEETISD